LPPFLNSISGNKEGKEDCRTIYSMDDNQITPEFIESMVNKIIKRLSDKLEELDISMDYIAAALMDDATVIDVSARQKRGRMGESNEEQSAK
jgi:hypothetical protein